MTYYISKAGTPTSDKTFPGLAAAIASLGNATHVRDNVYKSWGTLYEVVEGVNPTAARREARAALTAPTADTHGHRMVTTRNLSREMDRADSDY